MQEMTDSSVLMKFQEISKNLGVEIDSMEFSKYMDDVDPLRKFRNRFHYPLKKNLEGVVQGDSEDEECIYFCGHSLGLQLKCISSRVQEVLADWATKAVDCHLSGSMPAIFCDKPIKEKMAYLVGAEVSEVAVMNGLTVNIHVLLSSFYQPTKDKHKILIVDGGFHSDLYAVESHIALRGYDPKESIIVLKPKEGEHNVRSDDILAVINENGDDICLIFLEAVHYYTGQLFNIKEITEIGHRKGCLVGFDLAHAIGNVKLNLHEWEVDFALACTYKYLNSGPGCMGCIFVHQKHTNGVRNSTTMMRGWWGLEDKSKFEFNKEFSPAEGADRFRLSNPSPYLVTMILANLEVFYEAKVERLLEKQRLLTGYLEYLLHKHLAEYNKSGPKLPKLDVITPKNCEERGSQISLLSSVPISTCDDLLKESGIICDIRKPSVLRITPVPLYNTFTEVHKFIHIFKEIWESLALKY